MEGALFVEDIAAGVAGAGAGAGANGQRQQSGELAERQQNVVAVLPSADTVGHEVLSEAHFKQQVGRGGLPGSAVQQQRQEDRQRARGG